jgi:hypothetical protein
VARRHRAIFVLGAPWGKAGDLACSIVDAMPPNDDARSPNAADPPLRGGPSPVIERGRILCYRVFDAGDTIDMDDAERLLDARRFELGGPLIEGLVIPVRPLEVVLESCSIALHALGRELAADTTAHVFDFGAISLLYDIAIEPGTTLEELTPLCDALYDAPELDARGHEHRNALMARLGTSVGKPHQWAEAETYTIIFVEKLAGVTVDGHRASLADLSRSEAVAKLLLGETSKQPLSTATREDVLKNAFSYLADDLVVVDWNSALVVEPSGSRIVPFVLELATSQLLEFRYYDGLLDRELGRLYDQVGKSRPSLLRSPYAQLVRAVLRRFLELTEFTERVDNAIKSVGDVYLARVYLAAIRRFRVPDWRESVESKLTLVARAYELLKGEVEVSRSHLLEIIVVLLILVEVVSAFRGHG